MVSVGCWFHSLVKSRAIHVEYTKRPEVRQPFRLRGATAAGALQKNVVSAKFRLNVI
jgi:hypothetical protein